MYVHEHILTNVLHMYMYEMLNQFVHSQYPLDIQQDILAS